MNPARLPLALALGAGLFLAACGSNSSSGTVTPASSAGGSTVPEAPAETTQPDAAEVTAPETTTAETGAAKLDGVEFSAVTITGDPLPGAEGNGVLSDATDPANGAVAPTLSGTNFNGSDVTIGADGRPKAVYFLAHWCPHCQAEVDLIKDLVADARLPAEIDLYAVTIAVRDDGDNYPPSAWMEGFPGTVMRDTLDNEAATAAGVSGIPYTLYLDGDNKVLSRSIGSLDADQVLAQWKSLVPQSS